MTTHQQALKLMPLSLQKEDVLSVSLKITNLIEDGVAVSGVNLTNSKIYLGKTNAAAIDLQAELGDNYDNGIYTLTEEFEKPMIIMMTSLQC